MIKKLLTIAFSAISIIAAAATPDGTGENFEPQKFEYDQKIEFIEASKCERQVISDIAKLGLNEKGYKANGSFYFEGVALTSKKAKKCYVFYQKPKNSFGYEMTLLGHEVAHCIYGAYHDTPFISLNVNQINNDKEMQAGFDKMHEAISIISEAILFSCNLPTEKQEAYLNIWKEN